MQIQNYFFSGKECYKFTEIHSKVSQKTVDSEKNNTLNSFIYIYHSPNNRKNSKERAQQSNANTWTTSHGSHKDIPSSCIQMHKCILNV